MDDPDLTQAAFDAALARAGLTLTSEDREIALAEARNLHRAAALVRAFVADAKRAE